MTDNKAFKAMEDFELLVASLQAEVHDARFFPNVKSNLIPFGTYTRRNYAPSIESVRSALVEADEIKKRAEEVKNVLVLAKYGEMYYAEIVEKIDYILKGERS